MYKIKLSPYAKTFYNEWLLAPDNRRYNLVIDQTLYGNLYVEKLRTALKRYIGDHLLLNSHIKDINGELYWIKNAHIDELEYLDGSISTSELLDYVSRPFDLHYGPLYRFKVIRVSDDACRFIVVMHHLVMDGSASLDTGVFEAISKYYNDEKYAAKYSIDDQIKLITNLTDTLSTKLEKNKPEYKEFWHKQLSGVENIDLRFLKSNKDLCEQDAAELYNPIEEIKFNYGDAELAKLDQIKLKYGITTYIYGQCIFAMLLHRYTGQEYLAINYPIAIKEGLDFIYGAQINTNIIPYKVGQTTTIIDLFNQSSEFFRLTTRDAIKHAYYPIADIIQENNNRSLTNVCFAQTVFRDKSFSFVGIEKTEVSSTLNLDGVTKDLLLFEQNPRDNKLNYRVVYDKRFIDEELLNNFVISYKKLFIEILEDLLNGSDGNRISSYSLLDQQQYHKIVCEFNQTEVEYPHDKTIQALFEEQVLKTPDNIAVVYEDTKLTYQDLNNKANQLANYLRYSYNIKPDNLIAMCLDRNEQMLIAILGVLKSGGAYVPLDPTYPDERIGYVLDDTNTKVILTNSVYVNRLRQIIEKKGKNIDVMDVDNPEVQLKLANQESLNSTTSITSNNLVYALYTSGTTGYPKGVMLEHVSCVNRILGMISASQVLGKERVLFKTNYIFDVSFSDIFVTLLTGASLIVTKNVFDVEEIADKFVNQAIDICHFTPSQFEAIRSVKGVKLFEKLKIINFSGEALYPKLLEGINKNVLCANYYGPTEAGEVTFESVKLTKLNSNIATIGRALRNVKLFILDKYLMPLPIGAVGELYIGGDCLARGYLNNEQLTNTKFIINPLQTEQDKQQGINKHLYKTGDLVRRLSDGNIEYVGRNDAQVKIRGYRIELSEIEDLLLKIDGVKQAVAIVSEQISDGGGLTVDKHLVAYYVADRKLDEAVLYDYLLSHLSEYMVPNAIIRLDKLPLTSNGKLDKEMLPKIQTTQNYIAPNNQLQDTMVVIWAEILKLPKSKIGITESFFRLGGTSLSIIRLQHELSKIPKLKNIKVADLFKYTTIEQLTTFVDYGYDNEPIEIIDHKRSQRLDADTDIAVIAVSGAFSGCKNVSEYWNLILQGKEGLKTATIEKCKQFGMSEEVLQNSNFLPRSGHVADTDKFDAKFWGITPNEAKSMDPQIRKFLEHSWYLLETSGYAALRHRINIGVFSGGGDSVYVTNFTRQPLIVSGIGNLNIKDALATRVAYLLGLIGPANNINTACSTSLVTVVEACKSLVGNYCDMAIAGGSALLLPEEIGYIYQEGMIFSQDGHCRTFDQKASGTVHGSGVGVVLLKRLADAKKDGDNIIAVIKGYSTNNDGNRKISYTAPSVIGQKECIVKAQKMAKITSGMIDYVECHGTGTKLGDPIELQALHEAFKCNADKNNNQQPRKCIIGAVKANIGHAGAAAGIAGLIKVCQMLQYNIIPKQTNYEAPNTELHLGETSFEIITETRRWDSAGNRPRMAGISSFGIGGTNAHVIVSEYVADNQENIVPVCSVTQKHSCGYILPLSAKSLSSLEAYKKSFIEFLTNTTDNIRDIAYTLQLRREHFDYRASVVCNSVEEAIAKLKVCGVDRINRQKKHNVIFMFPGQGNQYANMSLNLYQNDNDYKKIVDMCIKLVNRHANVQFEKILFPVLFGSASDYDINQTEWAQPALFIIEYSLAKLLETSNINAVSYIGHSIGEYVAATLAGIFSLEDAIKLVVVRGQLMQAMPKGAMLSIQASATKIAKIIKNHGCEMAVINSPKNCVASGTPQAIYKLKEALDSLEILTIILNVSHAYHSSLMNEASKKFKYQLQQIKLNKPQKRFISNLTGNFITAYEAASPEYWVNQMRNTVLFTNGIETLFHTYNHLFFIEVGAGRSSISFVKQHGMKKYNMLQLLNSYKDFSEDIQDIYSKDDILNKLWMGGYNVDFDVRYDYENNRTVVKLPNYHFDNASYWIDRLQNVDVVTTKINLTDEGLDLLDIKSKVIEQDQPDRYYDIAKAFIDILGIEKISVYDDFFKLGADSLLAVSLAAKLQGNYKISVADIFKLRTVAKIAESTSFVKDNLRQKLERMKLIYAQNSDCAICNVKKTIKQPRHVYHHKLFAEQKKKIRAVLLTGATGHVGCNILYQLLHETTYKVYLLVRASSSKEASLRVSDKFKYYFDINLDDYKDRVTVLAADIEKQNLDLTAAQYRKLTDNIDSIIHSAALVKHYGDYDKLYQVNVQATINLLELAKQTKGKDFHYISTVGVMVFGYVPNHSSYVFDEDSDPNILHERNNVYARTKYEGELAVAKYREHGILGNIYRLGNVAMHSTNYRHQINIEDNAFFTIAKTILNFGITANEIDKVEVSPVDFTALAVVKIFDQVHLSNMVHHVFNPNKCRLSKLFNMVDKGHVKICPIDKLIDTLLVKMEFGLNKQVALFMLHQQWLQDIDCDSFTRIEVLQNKTNLFLQQLGFVWPEITTDMLSGIVRQVPKR